MTERVWRRESSRRSAKNAGFGLSIAKAVCDALDPRLAFALQDGKLTIIIGNLSAAENPQ